jgi:hypothetical protein
MADYNLKNIPDQLRARIQTEADRSFRSVQQEILFRLQRSFDADDARMTSLHAKWVYEALNSGDARPLSDAEIDAAINRGMKRAKARKQAAA